MLCPQPLFGLAREVSISTPSPPVSPHAGVAVGGVGGSGTRLVAELLRALGLQMGDQCLNRASDALWFTLLFKRAEIMAVDEAEFDLLTHSMVAGLTGGSPLSQAWIDHVRNLASTPRSHHPTEPLRAAAESLILAARQPAHGIPWGWKEPNTHVVIERLWQRLPRLRYVHVVRNGLDMAFSRNQQQVELWGAAMLGGPASPTPARSLHYWCRVQQRMQVLHAANPARMYWLDYDALCRDPRATLPALLSFLGLPSEAVDDALIERLGVVVPVSRHCDEQLREFAPADVAYVHSLGYR